jgi:branched-subunit amino acid aminotransferase/4-amino-4-deoxychorismate lyase
VEESFYFKHLHYTPSIRALRHADAHGYDDALWLNQHGEAMTFSTGCLGWMVGEDVFISTYSAPSIGLEALRQLRPIYKAPATLATLRAADAVFLINSTRGLVPLACLDTHAYSNDYAAFLTLSALWLTLAHNS